MKRFTGAPDVETAPGVLYIPAVQYHALSVARVIEETADARSFVLDVPAELAPRFAYQAGQFLTFRVPWEGGSLLRCYSLASCPVTERTFKVTVKRVDEGRVSNWFHDRVGPGSTLEVLPPAGRFVLRDAEAPLLLFGGGSGITPVISLVKSALATTRRRIRLVYANRDRPSIIFEDELDALARGHPERLEVVHHLDEERGFLDAAGAAAHARGLETAHCYVCGPGPFMEVVEEALAKVGASPDQVFIERFESPEGSEAPAAALAGPEAGDAPSEILVHLDGRTHRVPYTPGQSILRAALDAGLDAPFACEEGYCGSCAATRVEGEVEMATNDVFNEAEVAEGWILTCQGRARGARCEVKYDD